MYKEVPEALVLNLFARNDWYREDFNPERFKETKLWIAQTLETISKETEFKPTILEKCSKSELANKLVFCKNICNHRKTCKYLHKHGGLNG